MAKPTHAHNKSLNITKNIENVALTINNSQRRDKRVAKSVEFRKKENGNYIASIYPPEYALARPRKINEAIEMELIEFMQENEEKFKKSQMNHNFVFPRKYILSTNSSYNNDEFWNYSGARLNSSISRRTRMPNHKIFQQTMNTITFKNPTIKYNINQTIIKQNLKRIKGNKNFSSKSVF